MKLVLFDCDGTLIDSAAFIHAGMERAFAEGGQPLPQFNQTKSVIGLSLDLAIAKLLQRPVDDEIRHLADRYRHHSRTLREASEIDEPFYDGILDLLEALLVRDEVLVGVVTGKSRRNLDKLLERNNLIKRFVTTRTADECPSKPHPAMVLECCADTGMAPEQTIVVGDAIYDMQMAVNAGARAVGVSWGYAAVDHLHQAGAHHIIERPDELAPIVGLEQVR
ncbi:HAD-IA family hydrolase [Hoeflea prorocentri]|uniref:HAD-IA family hydrolase n=1 Tax=Hoeflea prorocentri TaxID=1922333 RepID=A0A9X3ZHL4_9HYPH|nr:HAD-IA family hydrolase [Hoeflea prorocentri]MCY6380835.1 HAD-IA family hydrolase [Hoeflea prorocentri]MDA5398635.1 HAD-IA family hydrolase [Hoeflea prorocentri]